MTVVSEEAFWVSGPGFVAWLKGQGLLTAECLSHRYGTYARQTLSWRQGQNIQIWTVDRLLTKLDRHISELPESIYIEPPPSPRSPRKGELTAEDKALIDRALEKEMPIRAIAQLTERSETTVRRYVRKQREHERS